MLYGDSMVRTVEEVTGVQSGLTTAGKVGPATRFSLFYAVFSDQCTQQFGYGLYDGISGFFLQPVKGAQEEGVTGFCKGFGKGIGGVVCKPVAGARIVHSEPNSQISL
jgi:hypothetical protein